MITLTTEQAQQIEEALHNTGNALMVISAGRNLRQLYGEMRDDAVERCNKALAAIRAARAQEQAKQEPVIRNPTAAEVCAYRDEHCVTMAAAKSALISERALQIKVIDQAPVAEVILRYQPNGFGCTEECKDIVFFSDIDSGTKLYAAPVRTKDLTDDVCDEIIKSAENKVGVSTNGWDCVDPRFIVRAVIAALKEKNK